MLRLDGATRLSVETWREYDILNVYCNTGLGGGRDGDPRDTALPAAMFVTCIYTRKANSVDKTSEARPVQYSAVQRAGSLPTPLSLDRDS